MRAAISTWRCMRYPYLLASLPLFLLLCGVGTSAFAAEPSEQQAARQALERLKIPYRPAELMVRARDGDTRSVELLLAAGADPNYRNRVGQTAVMWAADRGQVDSVKVLLAKGAAVNVADSTGRTALLLAVLGNHPATAQVLIEKGADVNARTIEGSILDHAATAGLTNVVSILLEKGADANARGRMGRTPLISAAQPGHTATVQALLDKGVDVNALDDNGLTALTWAAAALG